MHGPSQAVSLLWGWAWAWMWAWTASGVAAAAAIPPGLTTEAFIFTGPTTSTTPPPPPPDDFVITYKKAFASFVHLTFSYNATYNLSRVVVSYDDPVDRSRHVITLNVNTVGKGFDPTTLYSPHSGRLGFTYRLGGLYRRRRYTLVALGYQSAGNRVAYTRMTFLTGNDDGENKLYNLTGIFLVLGISTIIMVVVMVCVGYEKLILQKKDECCSFICCRTRKKKAPKASISPEPLVIHNGRGFDETSSSSHRY
ncbi:uncharacterized protein [Panulirus ornatus]|uniref:uncharacterized protein n=1 Tax=Panulirus ornatus TaxID=150431 RepID=UPI003A864246